MIRDYLQNRTSLLVTFVLVDARLQPQAIDLEFMTWMGTHQLPFVIVFTKSDKLTKNELNRNVSLYSKKLLETWDETPRMFITSSESHVGKDELLQYIEDTIPVF